MKKLKYGEISADLKSNLDLIQKLAGGSADLVIREITVNGIPTASIAAEGMVNSFYFSSIITDNLCDPSLEKAQTPQELFGNLFDHKIISPDQKKVFTIDDLFIFIYSGFGMILIDGVDTGIAFGTQGFSYRSVTSPTTDENIKGSKEGFTEALKINQTLIRRRIKSPELVFESIRMGSDSRTDCALVYMNKYVSKKLLKQVRDVLNQAGDNMDMVLESGSVKMLLTTKPLSLFSEIGSTERPDTLAKKLYEGKIGILIDGTPFVLIVPFLFAEHFHSLDDFAYKALYSNFIRFLKFSAFMVSFLLPGLYIAVATFHPQMLPELLGQKIMEAKSSMPYSFLIEALLIHFSYEIMREAGLRLPKEIGHAVSIVGGLIIGEAAVTAGIISAPMVLIAALSVISAFVVPALMDSLVILRFLLIFLGGFLGMYGIALGIILVCVNICAKTVFGIPYSSSIAPADYRTFASFLYKSPRQQFASGKVPKVQDMPGAGGSENVSPSECIKGGRISNILISASAFVLAVFSLWIYIQLVLTLAMQDFDFIALLTAIFILLLICENCTAIGCFRVSKLFTAICVTGGIVTSMAFIFYGLTIQTLTASAVHLDHLFILTIGEIIFSLLFLLLCRKKGRRGLRSIIFQEIICLVMILQLMSPAMISLLPVCLIFISPMEFLKLNYTVNLINDSMMAVSLKKRKIKPAICTALLIGSYLLFVIA